jgi:prepilin-type N-terminal cleavage/methylation domain-containing protein
MRKGFTLVEILVVIIVLPFLFLLFDGLFKTLTGEIPMSVRLIQENTSLLNMLRQVQLDTDGAEDLPKSFDGRTANNQLLLIKLSEGVICYQVKDGLVIREKLTNASRDKAEEPRIWPVPHAKIEWKVWERNGHGYAVQTDVHLEYGRRGQWIEKMAHSHLYFVGAIGKELR